jgi:hypothetical protein
MNTPKDPAGALAIANRPDNFLERLLVVEQQSLDQDVQDAPTFEDITDGKTGVFDLMISPAQGITVSDPTDVEYTGYFISGTGLEFDGNIYVAGNVVAGEIKTGFTDVGTLYAIDAVIEGTVIIGPGSEAGGWLIDATRIYNANITLDSSLPAILIGSATAIMTGSGVFMGNDSGTYKLRIGNPAGNYLLWDGTTLAASGQWIRSAGMNPALQEWQTNIVFSSASDTQVNWTSGTIALSDGTTYSISSGNTGAMAALTYIYLNIAVSLTVLQVTTTYSTATGDGKILIAAAQNQTAGASVLPFGGQQPVINGGAQITALSILAGNIAAGAITATKISVTSLSAITANMGALTIDGLLTMNGASGAITIGTTPPSSATVGTGLWIDRTGVYSLASSVQQTSLTSAGLTAGAGVLKLDATGIAITLSTAESNIRAYKLSDGTNTTFGIFGSVVGIINSTRLNALAVTGQRSNMDINCASPSGGVATLNISVLNGGSGVGTISMQQNAGVSTFDINSFGVIRLNSNTTVGANLTVTGDFAIGGPNTLNVTAATGNTTIAGTLGITGLTTLTGGMSLFGGTAVNTTAFTPVVAGTGTAGTATYSTQLGFYVRLANVFYFEIVLVWTGHTGTGNMQITGLPVAAANLSVDIPVSIFWSNITLAAAGNKLMGLVNNNSQIITMHEIAAGGQATLPMDAAGALRLSGFYFV